MSAQRDLKPAQAADTSLVQRTVVTPFFGAVRPVRDWGSRRFASGTVQRRILDLAWTGVREILVIPWVGVLIAIVGIGVFAQLTAPCGCFTNQDNLLTTAQNFSYVGIAALGGSMVIMTRGIDLSVGSNIALSALVTTEALNTGMPALFAIAIGLGVGLLVGLVNGSLITVIGLQPFIATLGMLSVVRGAALARTGGFTIYPPDSFQVYGQGTLIGPVPNPVVVMLVLMVVFTIFLNYTRLGRHIYAVGGNENAARLLGIKTKWVKVFVYSLAGLLAGVAGVLFVSAYGSASPSAATGYELDVIAAAVIGGVSLFGGEGTLIGAILGAGLIEEIHNVLDLENVPGYWVQMIIGLVILTAVAADQARRRLRRA